MFANCLGIIEAVARLGENATIGNVQKMNIHLTRGQTERVMNNLRGEGYLDYETVAYGKTGKKIWRPTPRADTNITIVANSIQLEYA